MKDWVFQDGFYFVDFIYISDAICSILVMSPVQIIMRKLWKTMQNIGRESPSGLQFPAHERIMKFSGQEVVMRCFQSPSASFSHISWCCMRVKGSHSHSKQAAFVVRTFLQRHQLSLFPDVRRSYNLRHELSSLLHRDFSLRHLVQSGFGCHLTFMGKR
jgi:hypothetical protein